MNESHGRAMNRVAKQLERDGYQVLLKPGPAAIPFDVEGYRPDILAIRGDEHLIVEVKSAATKRSLEKYKSIADTVSRHPHWRFLLTTVSPEAESDESVSTSPATAGELELLVKRLDALIASESYEFAIPYLWNALITGLRTFAFERNVPVDVTSDLRVINYMYSLGEISHADYETVRSYLNLRNSVVHAIKTSVPKEQVLEFNRFVRAKLAEWGVVRDPPSSQPLT